MYDRVKLNWKEGQSVQLMINNDIQTVSARDLHEKLNISTRFNDWFPRMCEYGFSEGVDFYSKMSKTSEVGGRPATDYNISIEMAKEICMLQRTPEGKKVRLYLIKLEKAWNTPEIVMARALKLADKKIASLEIKNAELTVINKELTDTKERLENKIESNQPKVDFYNQVRSCTDLLTIGEVAKIIGVGSNTLFNTLREIKILMDKYPNHNVPYQKYMDNGCFKVKLKKTRDGRIYKQTYVTPKGVQFLNKYLVPIMKEYQ